MQSDPSVDVHRHAVTVGTGCRTITGMTGRIGATHPSPLDDRRPGLRRAVSGRTSDQAERGEYLPAPLSRYQPGGQTELRVRATELRARQQSRNRISPPMRTVREARR